MHVNKVNFHHKTIHHFSGLKIGEINKIANTHRCTSCLS